MLSPIVTHQTNAGGGNNHPAVDDDDGGPGSHPAALAAERERQNRTAYRYGLCMVCLGVLLNWLGFYEHSLNPVRYLGLGCVLGGGVLISAVMCRSLRQQQQQQQQQQQHGAGNTDAERQHQQRTLAAGEPPSLDAAQHRHRQELMEGGLMIDPNSASIVMAGHHHPHRHGHHRHHRHHHRHGHHPAIWMTKPPDYFAVVGVAGSDGGAGVGGQHGAWGADVNLGNQQPLHGQHLPAAVMMIAQPPPSYEEAMRSPNPGGPGSPSAWPATSDEADHQHPGAEATVESTTTGRRRSRPDGDGGVEKPVDPPAGSPAPTGNDAACAAVANDDNRGANGNDGRDVRRPEQRRDVPGGDGGENGQPPSSSRDTR